jgi:thymidylate synthase ThyX
MITAKIIEDSISDSGRRLTTVEATYPRFIHAEVLTHRVFSRNAASSRAIPVLKMIDAVENNLAMPIHWGKNQKGMQAREEVEDIELAKYDWQRAACNAIAAARALTGLGVHKQIVNRLLEPFSHITTIISATEWANFFELRMHPDAQPEMQALATAIFEARKTSVPTQKRWHFPYVSEEERATVEVAIKISVARCARVSYLTHDGKRDIEADLKLHNQLLTSRHLSPFEHQATPGEDSITNFKGWIQYREFVDFVFNA